MNLQEQCRALRSLDDEAYLLRTDETVTSASTSLVSWKARATSALMRTFGPEHHLTQGFLQVKWSDWQNMYTRSSLDRGLTRASGFLQAAADEAGLLSSEEEVVESAGVDPELWEHVAVHVANKSWSTVASQTAIFTEDRIRRWTGRPVSEVGEKLMTAVLGETGDYRLGRTSGEKNGWHRLGMGISMALRNVDAHRIQNRPDHRLYALGVVGTSSLLLTQLRYEHGNRFQDTSRVTLDQTSGRTS